MPFYFDSHRDTNDHKEWTPAHIDDLRAELEHGGTVEPAAEFLCRRGTVDDVRRKAIELGLIRH
jgi:hypothetical protein